MKKILRKMSAVMLALMLVVGCAISVSATVTKSNFYSETAFDGYNVLPSYEQLATASVTKNSKTMHGYNYTMRSVNNVWRCVQTSTHFPETCTNIRAVHEVTDYLTGATVYKNRDDRSNSKLAYAEIHSWQYSRKISNFGCVEAVYNGVVYTEYPTTIGW